SLSASRPAPALTSSASPFRSSCPTANCAARSLTSTGKIRLRWTIAPGSRRSSTRRPPSRSIAPTATRRWRRSWLTDTISKERCREDARRKARGERKGARVRRLRHRAGAGQRRQGEDARTRAGKEHGQEKERGPRKKSVTARVAARLGVKKPYPPLSPR